MTEGVTALVLLPAGTIIDESNQPTMSKDKEKEIKPREDVNPEEGIHKYGNVTFADPVNHKYPLDTPEHVRAAHRYINQADNAAKYNADEVKLMKERIAEAAHKHGVEIHQD
jgi:hypothetical protein